MPFRKSRSLPSSRLFCLFFLALPLSSSLPYAAAQASPTATRSAGLSAFGGLQFANPEYGPPHTNKGIAFGVDYTQFLHFHVEPSLEIRANFNNGPNADERSYLFGPRAIALFGPLQPYADFLFGPGDIHFPNATSSYTGDNSVVYNYGGGIDLRVTHNFFLKLDIQGQHWNTGEVRFTPLLGTVGITYQIPFRPHNSQATIVH